MEKEVSVFRNTGLSNPTKGVDKTKNNFMGRQKEDRNTGFSWTKRVFMVRDKSYPIQQIIRIDKN